MLTYYFELALRSFRRTRGLTTLMVLAIAMGIGASMTTLAALRVLSGDPLPGHSANVLRVQIDSGTRATFVPGREPDDLVTLFDARALLRAHRAERQAMMTGGNVGIEPAESRPFKSAARYTTADFFPMFGTPFLYGGPWSEAEDEASARVTVLGREMAERLFGDINPVGRIVHIGDRDYRVVGVLADWQPVPYFFDPNVGRYRKVEGVFLPFATALDQKLATNGSMRCFGDDSIANPFAEGAPCTWIQFWVQLSTPEARRAYFNFLHEYSAQQHHAGRLERDPNPRLYAVMDWLAVKRVVPDDARLQIWLAFGFLAVCLLNTVGLLLAKCLRRAPEIGIRRALGASRRQVFEQFLVEAAVLGFVGGAVGLALAALGTWAVRLGPSPGSRWVHLDASTFFITFALAVSASLVAGILPAWRACQISPASQLKSA